MPDKSTPWLLRVNPKMDARGFQTGMGRKVFYLKTEPNTIYMYSYVYDGNNDGNVC
jgi:hypothetical protein